MDSISVDFDITEFDRALAEIEKSLKITNHQIITVNASKFLGNAVRLIPVRTGNMRSAATEPWNHLGIPGRPLTNVATGEKTIVVRKETASGKMRTRTYTVKSEGTYEDNRKRSGTPEYRFDLYAWDKRKLKSTGRATWRPYARYWKGHRRVIKAAAKASRWQWGNNYQKLFDKHSGK